MSSTDHDFQWGSRGSGGKDYCAICGLEKSKCKGVKRDR